MLQLLIKYIEFQSKGSISCNGETDDGPSKEKGHFCMKCWQA
jgi:hypothetical protein